MKRLLMKQVKQLAAAFLVCCLMTGATVCFA